MNWTVQDHTGDGTTKKEEAEALIHMGNGEILGGQKPSNGNRERGMDLRDTRGVEPQGTW